MSDADARAERDQLGLQIVGPSYNSRKGIMLKHITAGLKNRSLTGELGLRAFFMAAFQCLLFSNTDTNIRLDDVRYTQDIQNIGTRTWCKAVVDRLSVAARLYKLNYAQKGINAPISGCTIFLVVSSSQISIFFMFFVFIAFFQLCTYFCCNHIFHCCNLALAEVFFAISFCFISVLFFFRFFFADVIRGQLAARIPDKPFFHPLVLFPALEDDSSYTQRGPRGDVAGDIVEFGHLRVFLQSHLFLCKCHHCFFTPTMVFAILSFLLIFVFPLSFFNDLQLKSITDTCYGAPVGSLTVLPLPRFGPA
jgi:hypothetical protein